MSTWRILRTGVLRGWVVPAVGDRGYHAESGRAHRTGASIGHADASSSAATTPRAARCTPVLRPKEAQMRAMVLPRFGGPDLFEAREVERPSPGPGEGLVRVVATAVNPVDAKLRADGSWAGLRPPVILLGYDAAGVVEEAGPGVSAFLPR